jgi:2-amino-4-hydroxy-6-hydroxymethyldihydropteridine diphosphokinase
VAIGANLGEPLAAVRWAIGRLAGLDCSRLVAQSAMYRSAPVDAHGPDFINAVVRLDTGLTAPALLEALHGLEEEGGRKRPFPSAPRTLDLDLLLYGSASIDSERLTVPHPRMRRRAFVLVPLADIAPHLVQPAELAAVTSQVIARIP